MARRPSLVLSWIVTVGIFVLILRHELFTQIDEKNDSGAGSGFHPTYLSAFSLDRGDNTTLTEDDISRLFPFLGRDRHTVVNAKDIAMGHRWKTYMLPIDPKFNEGAINTVMTRYDIHWDCYTKSCDPQTIKEGVDRKQRTDYLAEVIIFKKLLASLYFVKDINDADLIWVPVLGVSYILSGMINGACSNFRSCRPDWINTLSAEVAQKTDSSKKHLYLASRDYRSTHPFFQEQHTKNGNIVVSLGPGSLVAPSLNSEEHLQPYNWKGCKPLGERKHFILANFFPRSGLLLDRTLIIKELDAYKGNKSIARIDPLGMEDYLTNSVMTLCPPGDLPFTKRFYDVLLSCSIPVAVKREVKGVGATYFSHVARDVPSPSVEDTYPALDFPYADIVVEVDGSIVEKGGMMKYLESIPWDVLETKWEKISEVRNRFVYDLNGTTPDAFSVLLETLGKDELGRGR